MSVNRSYTRIGYFVYQHHFLSATSLPAKGLNLQAVFNLDSLPADVIEHLQRHCQQLEAYRQLLLFGHGGTALWQQLKKSGMRGEHPIDDHSRAAVEALFAEELAGYRYQLLFPGEGHMQLQRLGELAGWHYPSPFRVGINQHWGSWFAYRAVALADTVLEPSRTIREESPCASCQEKPCINHCPARALEGEQLNLDACINYRLSSGSLCKQQCLARQSCPVSNEHRYSDEQIAYHYGLSMQTVEAWQTERDKV